MWQVGPCIAPEAAGVDAHELELPEPLRDLAGPPLFIVGAGRSGKTMVFDLFDRHPQVHAIFESWLLTPHVGVTGVFHQPQWDPAFYEHQRAQVGHPHAATQLVSYAQVARDLGTVLARWLVASMPADARYLVEKTPAELGPLSVMFPGARVLHVVRDGRDVAASVARAAKSWAPNMSGDSASFWNARVSTLRADAARLGHNYMELRFEDMRADMEAGTREVFEFAGIPVDDELLPQLLEATAPAAYTEGARASGFRGKGDIGGWRSTMTRAEGEHFDAAAGELLVDLGYAQSRDWWRELPQDDGPSRAGRLTRVLGRNRA
jgi:hypothetical protein